MFNPQRKLILVAIAGGVIFIVGMVQLFLLRFEAGDVYPAYSSLRTDPLGIRALYEGLERVSVDSVSRNYRPLRQVDLDTGTTLMIIGIAQRWGGWYSEKYDAVLEKVAQSGGRLVLTFQPANIMLPEKEDGGETSSYLREKRVPDVAGATDETDETDEIPDAEDETCNESEEELDSGLHSLGFSFHEPDEEGGEVFAERFFGGADILPPKIPWRALLSFKLRDNNWETIYTWQGQPVLVQRQWGEGSVVMVADSYLLSNEALRNHRFPGLLTWLVQPGHQIIFDESLKGLIKQPGIAGLTRQYRLHGVIAAVLVVVVLFVWRQAAIFIAPVQSEKTASGIQPATGRDTREGLVHLARQHVDTRKLLPVCFQAWKGQAAQRMSADRIAEVETMVSGAATDQRSDAYVKTYIEICELLKQGKRS